ncbi:MAG: ImmA/IrrE family metallo-endopeptidase [Caldisericales bacterium]|nr:ImmA/IrrE family metallo-endopeptidase [Caldisericales bacterium]
MPLCEADGVLVRTGRNAYVAINSLKPFTRRRFSIAHELGHFLMHDGEPAISSINPLEMEANFFACNLLMPARIVIDVFNKIAGLGLRIELIAEMAWIFRVSRVSMARRLYELEIDTENL